jgi:Rrf2 family protein
MKLITRDADYAIRALVFMARHQDKVTSVGTLNKALKIPWPFLRKLLQALNKKGLLVSHKGIGGGFRLRRRPEEISLVDLIKIFQGRFSLNQCFFKHLPCPRQKTCLLKKKVSAIERYVFRQLKGVTVASLSRRG